MPLHHFAATVEWTGAKQGTTKSYETYSREYAVEMDGKPTLIGSAAGVFRGDQSLHNPEDLLIIAVSTCHLLSYLALCARKEIEVASYTDRATAKMGPKDGVVQFLEAALNPIVKIVSGNLELAKKLHEDAHAECYIANSVKFPIFCSALVEHL